MPHRIRTLGISLIGISTALLWVSCYPALSSRNGQAEPVDQDPPSLTAMSLVDDRNADFEEKVFNKFASQGHYQIRCMPSFESVNERLALFRELFRFRSPQPDIVEIDVIWPSILADDLVDLQPYLGDDAKSFPRELINAFTVRGRLVAIPLFVDTGLLYYRPDLLRKYGFSSPPQTWDEMEKMAKIIQTGERRNGKRDFWGYVWQGAATEALTCNALEWQTSENGGHILHPDGTVHVCNRNAIRALSRAVSWVGTISPPGVIAYDEDDSKNVWQSGNAAFMRSWVYVYGSVNHMSCPVHGRFGVAMLPGGAGGRRRALGGIAIAVSKLSDHRDEAVAAVRYLTSAETQELRARDFGGVPTRSALQQRSDLMADTPFHGLLAGQVMTGVTARPSVAANRSYDEVSRAYSKAVHKALTRQASPENSLADLEHQLVQITGFRAVRD